MGRGGDATLLSFFTNNSRKSGLSRRNFHCSRVNQFYTYPENLMTLTQLTFDL